MSPIGIVLLAILVLILIGGVGAPYIGNPWPNGYGFGWGGNGVIGVVLVIILILALLGRL